MVFCLIQNLTGPGAEASWRSMQEIQLHVTHVRSKQSIKIHTWQTVHVYNYVIRIYIIIYFGVLFFPASFHDISMC